MSDPETIYSAMRETAEGFGVFVPDHADDLLGEASRAMFENDPDPANEPQAPIQMMDKMGEKKFTYVKLVIDVAYYHRGDAALCGKDLAEALGMAAHNWIDGDRKGLGNQVEEYGLTCVEIEPPKKSYVNFYYCEECKNHWSGNLGAHRHDTCSECDASLAPVHSIEVTNEPSS